MALEREEMGIVTASSASHATRVPAARATLQKEGRHYNWCVSYKAPRPVFARTFSSL
jgi:hypothetical protein